MTKTIHVDPWSVEALADRQQKKPIFITNATCENAHGSMTLFRILGLSYSQMVEYVKKGITEYDYITRQSDEEVEEHEFYPLTADELKYIAESEFETPEGDTGMMGYSAIYQGKKWLYPSIEVVFGEAGGYKTRSKALVAARKLVRFYTPRLANVGGKVFLDTDADDRFDVGLLIPFNYISAVLRLRDWKDYKKWLSELQQIGV
jgi:hypothetical protein